MPAGACLRLVSLLEATAHLLPQMKADVQDKCTQSLIALHFALLRDVCEYPEVVPWTAACFTSEGERGQRAERGREIERKSCAGSTFFDRPRMTYSLFASLSNGSYTLTEEVLLSCTPYRRATFFIDNMGLLELFWRNQRLTPFRPPPML